MGSEFTGDDSNACSNGGIMTECVSGCQSCASDRLEGGRREWGMVPGGGSSGPVY